MAEEKPTSNRTTPAAKSTANKLSALDPSLSVSPGKAGGKTKPATADSKDVKPAVDVPAEPVEWWPKPKQKPVIDPPANKWFRNRPDEIYFCHMAVAVFSSYVFGRMGLGFLPSLALTVPAYYLMKKARAAETKYTFHREVTDAKLWEDPAFVEKIMHEIPPWVRTPDWEKAAFLQKMITQMWPYIRKCADQGVRENVNPILKDSCPGFLKSIKIGSMNMGAREPEILGLQNTALKTGNRSILDIKMILHKMSLDLDIETAVGATITAGIRDLTIKGTFRTVLWPLIDYIPLIGGIRIGFAKRPQISLNVQTGGLGVNVPGLDDYLNNLVEDIIVSYFCYPNDVYIPMLEEKDAPDAYEPKGMLRIMVKEGRGLQEKVGGIKKLLKGKIDPYIKISVHGLTKKTRAKDNTANPEWHQVLEFVLRSEPEDAELDLEVWDKDLGKDSKVSTCKIDLKDWILKEGNLDEKAADGEGPVLKRQNSTLVMNERWVKMDDGPGEVLLGMVWKPYYKNVVDMQKNLSGATSGIASPGGVRSLTPQQQGQQDGVVSNTGLLMLTVRCGKALKIADKNSSDPFVKLKLIEVAPSKPQKFKTTTKFKTLEPSWDEEFQFTIKNSETDKIKMVVYDYDKLSTNDFLGECELTIAKIVEHMCTFDDWIPLTGVKTGSLQIKARYFPN